MRKPFTPVVPHRLPQLAVALGLAFAMPVVMAGDLYGVKEGSNYALTVGEDGKVAQGTINPDGTADDPSSVGKPISEFGDLYGRYSASEDVSDGQVTIKNGDVTGTVYGGRSEGKVSDNHVTISGGTIQSDVYGGSSATGNDANNNTVTISGGSIEDDVYGGLSAASGEEATDNTVELNGNTTIAGTVYGGATCNGTTCNIGLKGVNTSNTIKAKGVNTVKAIDGFKNLELTVGKANTEKGGSNYILTTTGTDEGNKIDLTGKTVTVENDSEVNNSYQKAHLLKSSKGITFSNTTLEKKGTFEDKRWKIEESGITGSGNVTGSSTTLTLNNDNVEVTQEDAKDGKTVIIAPERTATENSKTLAEALLGTVAIVNQGTEFIADNAMPAINEAVGTGKSVFGTINGGSSKYQTGSHIDVDAFSLAAGIAGKVTPDTTLAGFVEAGWGSSTSHVSHAKGSGEHEYYGVGLAAKHQFSNPFYVDGAVRMGVAKTAFDGRYAGDKTHYNADMFYTAAHVGGGYVFNLMDKVDMDLYARYAITWLEGDDVELHDKANSKLHMGSTTTHALRGGLRFTGDATETLKRKAGLAYEHIFNGDADTNINGLGLDTPTLEGDTGIGEVGLTVKPSANSPWQFDLTAKGYVGDREGYSGNVTVNYAF